MLRPTFPFMLLQGVDPFAVYRCQRRLRDLGVAVARSELVSHYLAMGQLDTLVRSVASRDEGASVVTAMKSDLLNFRPGVASNPRLVNPLAWTIFGTVVGGVLTSILAVAWIIRWPEATASLDLKAIAVGFGAVVLTSACYAFLGYRFGRRSAAGATMIVVLAVFAVAVKLFGPV